MNKVKSFSVGNGDMFYIKHDTGSFTTIDCCLSDDNKKEIVDELKDESSGKNITRFISTHPDEDHIQKLDYLDCNMPINNFYCVKNEATKDDETDGFKRYKKLRDQDNAFDVYHNFRRKWINKSDDERGSAEINFRWPKTENPYFEDALKKAKDGQSPNNISPIFTYAPKDSATIIWMGDLENDFMKNIIDKIILPSVNILFAPHHGRKSGEVPKKWLEQMNPDIIVMGEAPSKNLDYAAYDDYNKITQNSAGDIIFDCLTNKVNVYVSNDSYSVDFLDHENLEGKYDCNYLGVLNLNKK